MKRIATLTLNPSIDGAAETKKVRPIHKVRTWGERYDPGGGGINAARVIKELGGSAFALYLAGGITGPLLDALVRACGLECQSIPIADDTRISQTVHEHEGDCEYRFVPEGPTVTPDEGQVCLAALKELAFDFLIASGSLPQGLGADFYSKVADVAERKGARLVLDTSGEALRQATAKGVYLIKPSRGELEELIGRSLPSNAAQERAVEQLVEQGAAEIVALTLGRDGAVLGTKEGLRRLPGLKVSAGSAVGAGDSFVGAMTLGLAQDWGVEDAFVMAVAAGTAAALTMGTELCRRDDVLRIHEAILEGKAI